MATSSYLNRQTPGVYVTEVDAFGSSIANGVDNRQRADNALMGIVGKRLTYAQPRFSV
jgi:hypothetical protein